ncbi:Mbov_0396 family ICE element transmembrane protein [Spiroplasma turonicum]|uniref:Transmembrane protein n=1 Tax=Spiroplasma turonicum TaxID=216946 RepID=A0A0K1P7P6_9MOLU|nr:hypothetical protein [Spiroplasma turonicum]AKU79907.1 hypothetical protein STURON_00661 [Spiroplasma turonicum]ALX70918.1 hypothetical protein STURO_v1c06590 [Spiroplasma turonicum]
MFDWIPDLIMTGILNIIWLIFIQGPLSLISAVHKVFVYLTTGIVYDIIFNGKKDFDIKNIPTSFWAFCILGLFLSVLIFTIQYFTYTFNEDLQLKERIAKSLKSTGLAIVFVFFIPIGFYGILFLIEFLNKSFQLSFGTNSRNLADILYKLGDKNWDGSNVVVPNDYGSPDNIKDYNMIVEILGVWFLLYY